MRNVFEGPIVFVEDDEDDQYIFTDILRGLEEKAELLFFRNGPDFLQYLSKTPNDPFLILCDINLPGMTGIEVRRVIDGTDYLRKKSIPFIFLTTVARRKDIAEAYDLTVQGFFEKDKTFRELKNTFDLILRYWRKCKHP